MALGYSLPDSIVYAADGYYPLVPMLIPDDHQYDIRMTWRFPEIVDQLGGDSLLCNQAIEHNRCYPGYYASIVNFYVRLNSMT